ncbi:S-adenosyl-L-methionine-dependent methyltransferase [Gigaspora rosea]|uniref:S-adenosyl-L-methionine-dependent methyltransferase n=1 Tax=Gigaspora rosea TaxID=44941 RepID=A0A397V8I8_9GLOM|nr:S-adenosyl-L-methionine-dependent methyltransferase [Gigaspora rosea]
MGSKQSKYPKLIKKINKASNDIRQNDECPQLAKQDDQYIDRMQLFHHVIRCVSNGNFKVPLNEQLKEGGVVVLDFCCGTGTWLSEMASDFPNSTFVGIEKDSMYPEHKPKNVKIVQANVLEKFPFQDDTFDFVYSRLNFLSFSESQWKNHLIKELIRVLKPGGYLECIDHLGTDNKGPILEKFSFAIEKVLIQAGRSPSLASKFSDVIEFEPQMGKVTLTEVIVPIGSWGGELGLHIKTHMMSGLNKGIMHHLKISEKNLEKLWDDFKIEVNTHRTIWKINRYISQKN